MRHWRRKRAVAKTPVYRGGAPPVDAAGAAEKTTVQNRRLSTFSIRYDLHVVVDVTSKYRRLRAQDAGSVQIILPAGADRPLQAAYDTWLVGTDDSLSISL